MNRDETVVVALAAAKLGIVKNAQRAATALRSCNNAALAARYGDQPVALRWVAASVSALQTAVDSMGADEINKLAREFAYQCMESNVYETHDGGRILRAVIESTGGAA